jgi:hypothetical protein
MFVEVANVTLLVLRILKLKICKPLSAAVPPLLHTPSWLHSDNFTSNKATILD